ncbi:MFS transporter [Xanthobacteraceae bacterium A53D]
MTSQALPITAGAASDALYKRIYWRLIPLLIVCFIVAYYDRVNISFAKLQMQDELKFSDTVYGLGASLFFVGYILFEVPSNIILHRVGARKWIARIMVSWGIASALMMFVTTPVQFYAMRFIVGAMEAGFLPGVVLYFTYWFPPRRRARANSLFMTAISLSGITGGPLAGWIMTSYSGAYGWSGWQWLFLLSGIPAVVLGIVVFFFLDDRPSTARWLTATEKRAIEADIAASETIAPEQHSVLRAFSDPRALFLSGVYFLILVGLGGVTFWMPQLIKNAGNLDTLAVGEITAIPWLIGGLGMLVVAFSSDRTGERKWHLALAAIASGIGYAVSAAFPHNLVLAVAGLSLATLGILAIFPVFWTVPSTFLGGAAAASGIAFINSMGNLGSVFSPTFIGWVNVQTQSTQLAINVVAGMMVLAGLLILFFWPRGEARKP